MKELTLKGLDQNCFCETLKNGLEIVLIPYQDKKNYYMTYVTRYGSEVNSFVPKGEKKMIQFPNGIAHFLEHKMFEQETGEDPFTFFSKSGSGGNAATSFNSTQYICYGTKEFEANLRFLLNYVNAPYFTDSNVLKEKGIIKEEIKMYDDIPESVLENKLREMIYQTSPRRYDIAGTVEDVDQITKEDLYKCYHTFYQPNNMFLIIAGNFDYKKALQIVEEEVGNIDSDPTNVKIKDYKEPKSVFRKEQELPINIKVPKIGLGYKFSKDSLGIKDELELDLYLVMLTTILFGSSSLFREEARNRHLMTNFYHEWDSLDDYKTLMIFSETENPNLLIEEVEKTLQNIEITIDDVERIKKVWIANEVKMIDYVDSTLNNVFDDMIRYYKVIDNKIDLIRDMNKRKLDNLISNMKFTNRSKLILLPKKIITKKQDEKNSLSK